MNNPSPEHDATGQTPEALFAETILRRYQDLLGQNKITEKEQKRITLGQIAADQPLTALDTLPDEGNRLNPAFKIIYPGRKPEDFLKERIRGKALDVGSEGKNELEGIVDDSVYTDIQPFRQINFVQADAVHLPFPDATFDSVFSKATANNYDEAKNLLPEMLRVVKPEGTIVLHPHEEFLLDNLRVLREIGVDLKKQCELTILERYRQHDTLPLKFNTPSIYITVRLARENNT